MKLLMFIFITSVFVSCGGDSSSESSDSSQNNSSSISDCPTTIISFSDADKDSIGLTVDHSFDVKGAVGSFSHERLRLIIGDVEFSGDMYDYPKAAKYCVQISLDDVKVGTIDIADAFVPVQPYVDGSSINFYGSQAAYGDAKTTGTVTITNISESHVCGSFDITAYHGGVLKGRFSSALQSPY